MAPNTSTRAGRMLEALIASENKKGKVVLTTTVTDGDGAKRLHETFAIRKWTGKSASFLFIGIPSTADWGNGVKPITPISVNLDTGEVKPDAKDERVTPLLRYAAEAALRYAMTGDPGQPSNGKVEVMEEAVCGMCGLKLTDPVSIERGIGPDCFGKSTGSKTMTAHETAKATKSEPAAQGNLMALAAQIGMAA